MGKKQTFWLTQYIPVNGHSIIYLAFFLITGHLWLFLLFANAHVTASCCILLLLWIISLGWISRKVTRSDWVLGCWSNHALPHLSRIVHSRNSVSLLNELWPHTCMTHCVVLSCSPVLSHRLQVLEATGYFVGGTCLPFSPAFESILTS